MRTHPHFCSMDPESLFISFFPGSRWRNVALLPKATSEQSLMSFLIQRRCPSVCPLSQALSSSLSTLLAQEGANTGMPPIATPQSRTDRVNNEAMGYNAVNGITGLPECTWTFAASLSSVLSLKAVILYNPVWKCNLLVTYTLSLGDLSCLY